MSARRGMWLVVGLGLAVSLALAGVASFYASADPDGLERVAEDVGFLDTAADSALAGSPLADYEVAGVADDRLAVGLAGIIGTVATAAAAFGLFWWLARRSRGADHARGADPRDVPAPSS